MIFGTWSQAHAYDLSHYMETRFLLQARVKLIAFEYENKESRESNSHTKRLNLSAFKETPYRNLDMSQQP